MKKILFATTNEGKMREIRMIMEGSGYEITSLKDAGIKVDIDENGSTLRQMRFVHILMASFWLMILVWRLII